MANYNKVFSVKIYSLYYWIERIIAWLIYKVIFGCKIEGRENIDFSRTFIILANHCSHMDPPLVGYAVPKPIAYMAKSDLFKIPLLNRIMHWSGGYAVNRGVGDISYIENTLFALKQGWLVTIFPEGGRSLDGRFMGVKPGTAKVLMANPVPFLPVGLINTHKAWGKHKKINFSVKVRVKIGRPVYPAEYLPAENLTEEEKIKHISDIYSEKINELLPEEQRVKKQ
jgi:1-acyl-sn-glycerol-3-phosphate acyltransferase